jgi:hypothetical protein
VIGADVDARDGVVHLKCVVTDKVAAEKFSARAYSGILCSLDGDEVSDISLVDSPAGFLEKRAAPETVMAKIFERRPMYKTAFHNCGKAKHAGRHLTKDAADACRAKRLTKRAAQVQKAIGPPVLPPSAQRVVDEQQRIQALRQIGTDGLIVKSLQERCDQATGVELVKMARRNPQNQLYGPRYQR